MPPAVFKPIIPESERPQTHSLDCAATGSCPLASRIQLWVNGRKATALWSPVGGLKIYTVKCLEIMQFILRVVFLSVKCKTQFEIYTNFVFAFQIVKTLPVKSAKCNFVCRFTINVNTDVI